MTRIAPNPKIDFRNQIITIIDFESQFLQSEQTEHLSKSNIGLSKSIFAKSHFEQSGSCRSQKTTSSNPSPPEQSESTPDLETNEKWAFPERNAFSYRRCTFPQKSRFPKGTFAGISEIAGNYMRVAKTRIKNASVPSQVHNAWVFLGANARKILKRFRGFEKGLADRGGWQGNSSPHHRFGPFFCTLFLCFPYE